MDAVLALIVLAMPLLGLAAVVAPAVTMVSLRRCPPAALLLAVAALPLLVLWWRADLADFDRADATGAAGNAYAGSAWLLAALVAAAASVVLTVRRARRQRSNAVGCRAS